MGIIDVTNLSKEFKKKIIFENVSVSIERGEIFGLIGPSGCGKSVFLRMIMGFLKQDSGAIKINSILKDPIGFSLQENSIYENITVKQNLKYFANIYGVRRKQSKQTISNLIDFLNLRSFENTLVRKISGGTKKRVDLACALVKNPEIIILDEPLLGLDPQLVSNFISLIVNLNKQGRTIIITSHMLDEIKPICNRFFMIKNKNILPVDRNKLALAYE